MHPGIEGGRLDRVTAEPAEPVTQPRAWRVWLDLQRAERLVRGLHRLEKMLAGGAAYAIAHGQGGQPDLDRCEDHGVAGSADPAQVSGRAIDRGLHQVGSLGSGNHFLEVQAVDEIFDPTAAEAFGLAEAAEGAGLCRKAARLVPLGVIKG